MDHVFHRHCSRSLPLAVRGEGAYVYDQQGKAYLDACGGAAVSCLGHSHPRVIEAIQQQLQHLPYAHTAFFTTEASEALADHLVARAPARIDRCYFLSGGSEAMETALKLARQYFLEAGEPERHLFIARRQSYHGNTLGALSVGGNTWRREPFEPLLNKTEHISPCYAYRDQRDNETEQEYGFRVANELELKLLEVGPEKVLAFVAEPVVGATAGALPAVEGYFRRIREICDQYGILLILDEVMCGMGRTGTLFACEQEGIEPDMITIAKGLGGGYQPIGATLVSETIYNTIRDGSGFFQHGHTYMAHASGAAAALAVQQTIEQEGLLQRVQQLGDGLRQRLQGQLGEHPNLGDIRGRGLFMGLELVQDRDTKKPFAVNTGLAQKLQQQAMQNGLMCYPMAGTIDGINGHHILLAPPYIVTESQLDELVEKLQKSLQSVLESL